MTREETVRWLVLNEICDDFENVDQIIFPNLTRIAKEFGLTIERHDVIAALQTLIADGMARVYLLSNKDPFKTELPLMPSLEAVETNFKTYFVITPKGLEAKFEMEPRHDSTPRDE